MTMEELNEAHTLELNEIDAVPPFTRSYQVNEVPGGEGHAVISLHGVENVAIMSITDFTGPGRIRLASLALGPRELLQLHLATRLLLIDIDNRSQEGGPDGEAH